MLSPAASGIPGKTGQYDESVAIDSHLWLHDFLRELIRGRAATEKLFPVSGARAREIFIATCERLGLSALRPCMYGLRHGGASYDLLHKRRPLHSIKIRGRWNSDASLKRYAKESRLIQETHRVPRATLEFGMAIEQHLETQWR